LLFSEEAPERREYRSHVTLKRKERPEHSSHDHLKNHAASSGVEVRVRGVRHRSSEQRKEDKIKTTVWDFAHSAHAVDFFTKN
jgi:2'-5' RNA ligase